MMLAVHNEGEIDLVIEPGQTMCRAKPLNYMFPHGSEMIRRGITRGQPEKLRFLHQPEQESVRIAVETSAEEAKPSTPFEEGDRPFVTPIPGASGAGDEDPEENKYDETCCHIVQDEQDLQEGCNLSEDHISIKIRYLQSYQEFE